MDEQLQPGRELDALIEEKIYGKRRFYIDGAGWYIVWHDEPVHEIRWPREFSTNDAHAFMAVDEVLEQYAERRCTFTLNWRPLSRIWRALLWNENGIFYSADAATRAHAICLAALEAVNAMEVQG